MIDAVLHIKSRLIRLGWTDFPKFAMLPVVIDQSNQTSISQSYMDTDESLDHVDFQHDGPDMWDLFVKVAVDHQPVKRGT